MWHFVIGAFRFTFHNHSGVLYAGRDYEFDDYDSVDGIADRVFIAEHRSFKDIKSNANNIIIRKEFPESWIFEIIEKYARFYSSKVLLFLMECTFI